MACMHVGSLKKSLKKVLNKHLCNEAKNKSFKLFFYVEMNKREKAKNLKIP